MSKLITLKCWNRPIYLYRVLDSLKRCRKISGYNLLISIEKSDENTKNQIIEAIKLSGITNGVNQLFLAKQEEKLGCAGNTKFLMKNSFNTKYNTSDYVIHLEDDTVPAINCLEYFEQTIDIIKKQPDIFFASCGYNRPCHQANKTDKTKLVGKKWFDGAGGCAITKQQYDRINEMGGMFGVNYISDKGRTFDCRGEDWLKEIRKSDTLSWVWPFHKYFSENKYSIYPEIGVVLNIGKIGLHNNKDTYDKLMYNNNWFGSLDDQEEIIYNTDVVLDNSKYVEYGIEDA